MPFLIIGGGGSVVGCAAATETREHHNGIDDEDMAGVITLGESIGQGSTVHAIFHRYRCPLTVNDLPRHRPFFDDVTGRCLHAHGSIHQRDSIRTFEAELYGRGIRTPMHDPIVFQASGTRYTEIDTRIDRLQVHPTENRHVGYPSCLVITEEIIHVEWLLGKACMASGRRSHETDLIGVHTKGRRLSAWVTMNASITSGHEHVREPIMLQKYSPTGRVGSEQHLARPLSLVLVELDHGPRLGPRSIMSVGMCHDEQESKYSERTHHEGGR